MMGIAMVVKTAYRTSDLGSDELVGTLPAGRVVRVLDRVEQNGEVVYHVDGNDRWPYWPVPDWALVFDPETETE